jgi:DNA polymerase III sliding clamp (beta) subunit (PCNA family)
MKLKKDELVQALEKVKPGLANNEIIEQATHLIFDGKTIRTYNDEIAITQPFESNLTGTIPAKEFYNLFKKIPDDEITSSQTEGKWIFKGTRKQITFNANQDVKNPPIDVPGFRAKTWKKLPANFSSAAKTCIFSASRNMTMVALTGILFSGDHAYSSDNFRATRVKLDSKIEEDLLLPAAAAKSLINYAPSKHCSDANWLHFINDEKTAFSCRRLDEEFPKAVFDVFNAKGKKIILPSELKEVAERSNELAAGEFEYDKSIDLHFSKGKLKCAGMGDVGHYQEDIDIKYTGKAMQLFIQPNLLIEIIAKLQDAIVTDNTIIFKGESLDHLILLASNE